MKVGFFYLSGFEKTRTFNEYVVNEEFISSVLKAWLKLDPTGKGMISASDYLHFITNLEAPMRLTTDHLQKRLMLTPEEYEGRY